MAQELSGKVAVITGGANGIGKATVELFVEQGAKVVFADINAERGEPMARALGEAVRFRQADVANDDDMQALVDLAVAEFGGLHIMFNHAGIADKMYPRLMDDPLDRNDFQRVMNVNLRSVMVGTKLAAVHMSKHGGGSIINTSSMGGLKAGRGTTVYRASKVAINFFTKCAAIDLGEYNIRVNAIAPGMIDTGMSEIRDRMVVKDVPPDKVALVREALKPVWASEQPLRRGGLPIDIANAALYLASDRSNYVTGTVMPVEGGNTAGDMGHLTTRLREARDRALSS